MTNYSVKNVDEYIAASIEEARPHLKTIREAVTSAFPDIEEKIGYGKPYYKYHGWVVGFDVFKKHISFEVWDGFDDQTREELEKQGYKTGSVTFQIRYDQQVPTSVIKKLVKAQAKLNETKAANKKK